MDKRVLKGFLIAPLVPAGLFGLLASLGGLAYGGFEFVPLVMPSFLIWTFFALPVVYLVALVAGIPTYMLIQKLKVHSVNVFCMGVGVIGIPIGLVIGILFGSQTFWELAFVIVLGALLGMSAGYAFWWLAVRAHNQSLKPTPKSGAA